MSWRAKRSLQALKKMIRIIWISRRRSKSQHKKEINEKKEIQDKNRMNMEEKERIQHKIEIV
jgi:hypothetical protein